MVGIVGAVFLGGVLPVLINKTTESGHFPWLKPHLRQIWAATLYLGVLILFRDASIQGFVVRLHSRWPEWTGYSVFIVIGSLVGCACWWLSGKFMTDHLHLVFAPSPLMTDGMKRTITVEFDNAQEYLRGVGFDPILPIPPIQVNEYAPRTTDGKSGVGILSNRQSAYGESIVVSPYSAGQKEQMRGAYFSWAFSRYFDTLKMSKDVVIPDGNRMLSAVTFSAYYLGSYSDKFCGYSEWDKALWQARKYFPRGFTDTLMFYTFKNFRTDGRDAQKEFDIFFWNRLMTALSILDSSAETKMISILDEHHIKWSDAPVKPASKAAL